jgi:hypothetical protein
MAGVEYGEMETLPYVQVVEPFGKINVWRQPDGSRRVRVYVLMENVKEGTQTGVAIQGSSSMRAAFGFTDWRGVLFNRRAGLNVVSLTAQKMCSYLARKVDVDKSTTVIYWATGADGAQVEEIGDLTAYQAERYDFAGPGKFGSGAKLLPAVRYFADRFVDANWGMYVFVTDGRIQDMDAVQEYSTRLAQEIAHGRRNCLKLVLLGVGRQIDRAQMQQLDDLHTGTGVDLWDHRLAAEMRSLIEILAETVDENTIVTPTGTIRDDKGNVLRDYRATGLPAVLQFTLPPGAKSFTLEFDGRIVTQPLL